MWRCRRYEEGLGGCCRYAGRLRRVQGAVSVLLFAPCSKDIVAGE